MRRILTALGVLALASVSVSATGQTRWPDGAKAAVVLTYDDALASQLDNAVPVLDRHGFKATFFLSRVAARDVERWRLVANEGHELANHTVFHPCTKADFPAPERYTSEAYTPATMLDEIAQQNTLLTAIDDKQAHGFALPCGESKAGGEDYLETLRASGLVTYTRGVVTTPEDLRADVSKTDPMHIPAQGFDERSSASDMIRFIESARDGGGWAVLLFHGVGGDHLAVSASDHARLIEWLAHNRKDLWVTTLQQALDWAQDPNGQDGDDDDDGDPGPIQDKSRP